MRTSVFGSVLAFTLVGSVLVGCGGTTSDFVSGDDTGADGGDVDASKTDTGGAPDGTATDTGTAPDGTAADTGTATDTGTGPTDTGTGPTDTGPIDAAIKCGTATCTGGDICCAEGTGAAIKYTCAKTCADGGIALGCTSPADCGGGICCGTVDLIGSGTACTFKSGSSSCASTCATSIPFGCPGKATVRLCAKADDCKSDPANKNCCVLSGGGTSTTACVSDTIKSFLPAGTKCL